MCQKKCVRVSECVCVCKFVNVPYIKIIHHSQKWIDQNTEHCSMFRKCVFCLHTFSSFWLVFSFDSYECHFGACHYFHYVSLLFSGFALILLLSIVFMYLILLLEKSQHRIWHLNYKRTYNWAIKSNNLLHWERVWVCSNVHVLLTSFA